MPTILTDDGVTLSYRVQGYGPTTLLFMHGWAGSGAYFDEVVGDLDLNALQVITMDFRGHGDSERTTAAYDLDRIADDVWAVADAAQATRLVLVGFSMSGKFAQYVGPRVSRIAWPASCSWPAFLPRRWRFRRTSSATGCHAREIPNACVNCWARSSANRSRPPCSIASCSMPQECRPPCSNAPCRPASARRSPNALNRCTCRRWLSAEGATRSFRRRRSLSSHEVSRALAGLRSSAIPRDSDGTTAGAGARDRSVRLGTWRRLPRTDVIVVGISLYFPRDAG